MEIIPIKQMKSLEQVDRTDSELKKLCELVDFGADCMDKGGIPLLVLDST